MSVNIYQNGALHSVSGGEGHSITALKEASPASAPHMVGTYLSYNDNVYRVKAAIAVGDSLVVDTNIENPNLPNDTVVYWEDNTSEAGTSKHTIVNSSGTDMAMRERLQFGDGLITTDNSANGKTVVTANIEDSLTSVSTSKSLSANQGKVLGDEVDAIVNVYGSKNLNSYPYGDSTIVVSGLTLSDNGDGIISVSGTSTARVVFTMHHRTYTSQYEPISLKNGKYIISGCPNGGGPSTYCLAIATTLKASTGEVVLGYDYGDGAEITADGCYYSEDNALCGFYIIIESGVTVNNLTFEPMIRDARISDSTWVPYAKTNYELTQDVSELKGMARIHSIAKSLTLENLTSIGDGWYVYDPIPYSAFKNGLNPTTIINVFSYNNQYDYRFIEICPKNNGIYVYQKYGTAIGWIDILLWYISYE